MQNDLTRTSIAHETIRANPIPNAPVNEKVIGLHKMSRDDLVYALNELTRVMNSHIRAMFSYRASITSGLTAEQEERYRLLNAEWDARISYWVHQESLKDLAAHNDELALREEIIDALVEEGKARHVAANLTNTEAKMIAEGRRLGIL